MPATMISDDIHILVEQLFSANTVRCLKAGQRLIQLGSDAVPILLQELSQRDNKRDKAVIIIVLEEIRDRRSAKALLELLNDPSMTIRMAAAKALGNFPEARIVTTLLGRLYQETGLVQSWIILSLGRLGDQRAVMPLLNLLHQTPSASTKQIILRVLGELGNKQAIPLIRSFTTDPVDYVRDAAHKTLQQLSGDSQSRQHERGN